MSFWIPPGFDEDSFRAFVLRMPEVESVDRFDSVRREDVKEVPDLAPEYREGRSFRVTYRWALEVRGLSTSPSSAFEAELPYPRQVYKPGDSAGYGERIAA